MANPDARFGLRPVKHLNGSPWNGQTMRVYFSASYATAAFIGDAVDYYAGATLSNRSTAVKYPPVQVCNLADTTCPLGVIVSFEPDPTNLTLQYKPASTFRYANIVLANDVIFQIRDDGGAALTNVVLGQNAVGIATHAGDTITGLSGYELDAGTSVSPAANSSYPMFIVQCSDIEDNEWDGSTDTHMVWDVILNARLGGSSGSDYGILGITAT